MNDHDRFRAALAAYLAGKPHDDTEATAWVQTVEDEALLIQFFNGWGDLEQARTRQPQLIERALAWMRALKERGD